MVKVSLKKSKHDFRRILNYPMVEFSERGVAFWRLAFEDHCELCDAVQRRHGNADEAGHGPLALRARKVENTVGGLGRRLEERPRA